jgi:hypothetical protein
VGGGGKGDGEHEGGGRDSRREQERDGEREAGFNLQRAPTRFTYRATARLSLNSHWLPKL